MSDKIIIDGKEYDVAIIEMKRKADILDRYAHRSEDGVLHREVIGTYYNYSLKLYTNNLDLYEELFWVLSEPVASHTVELPTDHVSYEAYFSSVQDEVVRLERNGVKYKGLQCNLTAMRPRRIATNG